jgi:oxygen-independent coproporphyrinogen-3 oxidase
MNQYAMSPRAAYIHVPFCRHRCGYCNFTLVAGRDDLIEPFLAALETELSWLGQPSEVETLFFGGGTPTHLRGDHLRRLLETVLRWHPLAACHVGGETFRRQNDDLRIGQGKDSPPTIAPRADFSSEGERSCEFSVEANPADVDSQTVAILAEHGVTRISLGAQSFQAEKLRLLERDHQASDIARAVKLIRSFGLDVSLDLIFGVPVETLSNWKADLQAALQLSPDHISTYGLTFEQETAFWNRLQRGELARTDEEIERQMYAAAIDELTESGFEHYEVSNFACPGKRCRHNEVYWTGGEYFAAGPGAARHVAGVRETNHRSVTKWLQCVSAGQSAAAEREELPPEDKARELLVFGLRRLEGVKRKEFATQSGFEIDSLVGEPLRKFIAAGLLTDDGRRVRLSREGLFVSDSLWPKFLRK